jgi:hypothetical protein
MARARSATAVDTAAKMLLIARSERCPGASGSSRPTCSAHATAATRHRVLCLLAVPRPAGTATRATKCWADRLGQICAAELAQVSYSATMLSVEEAVKILHAEAIHFSDRYDRVMQGQERILTVVIALVAATLSFAVAGNHPEIYAGLPIALGLIFTFLIQLYADAESKQVYLGYLQTLINGHLVDAKKSLVQDARNNGATLLPRDDDLLRVGKIVESRAPGPKNPSQPLVIVAWGLIVIALFIKGCVVAHNAKISDWQEYTYHVGAGIIIVIMLLSTGEFLFTARKKAEIAVELR